MPASPGSIREHLARSDARLAAVLQRTALPRMAVARDLFSALLEAIVSQQLSVRAADTIWNRFLERFPRRTPTPAGLLRMSLDQLRSAGISRQKAGYLHNVARFARSGGLNRRRLARMDDETLVAELTSIKGVGRWTAEMLLMFDLKRPDVFPVDDVGIQQAMKRLYGVRGQGRLLHARMRRFAEAWRPYRSFACMVLWRWRRMDL